jgi:hypothetical protein
MEELTMPNGNESASFQSAGCTQPADRLPATPDPLGSPSDPLSSEDIDAQIRWFFDNVRERKSARL